MLDLAPTVERRTNKRLILDGNITNENDANLPAGASSIPYFRSENLSEGIKTVKKFPKENLHNKFADTSDNLNKQLPDLTISSIPDVSIGPIISTDRGPLKMSSILEDENSNSSTGSSENSLFKLLGKFDRYSTNERNILNIKQKNIDDKKIKEIDTGLLLPADSLEMLNVKKK